jgi:hypothetical protein
LLEQDVIAVLEAGEFEFDGHDVHVDPSLEYCPGAHGLHAAMLELVLGDEVPAVQLVQNESPFKEYFPA